MTVNILLGDVLEKLKELPADTFDSVVTSPPYWGLRDYGVEGQIGLEPTLGEHLDKMVEVFAEIHRVLKPEGTCWVNYGDCYATTPNGRSAAEVKAAGKDDRTFRDKPFSTVGPIYAQGSPSTSNRCGRSSNKNNNAAHPGGRVMAGGYLKPKDLVMVPNRFAIAMQEAGWWVRAECIWAKPNPMPESVRDRPATSHEKVFLFTKAGRYFYDAEAVRVERASNEDARGFRGGSYVGGAPGRRQTEGNIRVDRQRGHSRQHQGFASSWDGMSKEEQQARGRNLRNFEPAPVQVWEIATKPFKGAHFATFPPELVERCLLAGCPKGGHVLDPFGGAGTTALVADRLQMDCTLIELNPEYADIAHKRLEADRSELLDLMDGSESKQGELTL